MTKNSETKELVAQLKVLVIDDHMLMRNMIVQSLTTSGAHNVDTATNGQEAIEKLDNSVKSGDVYDLVFLDWHMPDVDGMETLKHCRGRKDFDHMAIVMLTAEQEKHNVLKAIECGATSYLIKPLSYDKFTQNLEKIMEWIKKNNPTVSQKGSINPLNQNRTEEKIKFVKDAKILPQNLERDLGPIVSQGVKSIFSEMFNVQIVPDHHVHETGHLDTTCIGRLYQSDLIIRPVAKVEGIHEGSRL